jgi:hypothetical protein
MEGWDRRASWDRDVLERIVALLFALANLADLAAGASFLRRRQVLEILNHGEVEARAFLIGVITGNPAPEDALEPTGDAERLAASFRALALLLCALLARRFVLNGAAGARAGRPSHKTSGPPFRWPRAPAPLAFDTS